MKKGIGLVCAMVMGLCALMHAQTNNVLVIIADDLGVDYMNRYGLGGDPAPTPVLDSLSDNGILFTNAWTNPICSPSRANILTGKYGFRTGIGTAITGLQNAALDTAEYTIAKAVGDQAGAATAMVGKWHLGHSSQAFRRNPNACGFDHYAGNVEGQLPNYNIWQKTVNGANFNIFDYATSVAVDDAISWVGSQSTDWMLFLSFNAPHEPFHRPPVNLHSFDNITTNPTIIAQDPTQHFKAMIEAMDTEIGRFLQYLSATGQLDNTNIIFIGDNGSPPEVAQAPFQAPKMKGTMYNGGIQVPLIISGPAVVNAGRTALELVNSTDLYHTILELFQGDPGQLPTDAATDSRSILPVITNSSDSGNQRPWIYGDLFKPTPNAKDGKAITDGSFKLIEFDNGSREFYNISTDYFENNPLNVQVLGTVAEQHYQFLCSELGLLLDTIFCETITSTVDFENQVLGVYPNPATAFIQIEPQSISGMPVVDPVVRIFNPEGRLVYSVEATMSVKITVDISHLPPSAYHVVLAERGSSAVIASSTFVKSGPGPVKIR